MRSKLYNYIRNNLETNTRQTEKQMEDNINMDFRQVVRIVDAGPYKMSDLL